MPKKVIDREEAVQAFLICHDVAKGDRTPWQVCQAAAGLIGQNPKSLYNNLNSFFKGVRGNPGDQDTARMVRAWRKRLGEDAPPEVEAAKYARPETAAYIESLIERFEDMEAERDRLADQKEDLEQRVSSLTKEMAALTKRAEGLEQTVEKLRVEVREAEELKSSIRKSHKAEEKLADFARRKGIVPKAQTVAPSKPADVPAAHAPSKKIRAALIQGGFEFKRRTSKGAMFSNPKGVLTVAQGKLSGRTEQNILHQISQLS